MNRTWARHGNSLVAVLAALAITCFANYFGAKYWKQWDWTASRFYSLSEKSEETLKALTSDVSIVCLLSDRAQPQVDAILREVRKLADAYHTVAPDRVRVEQVDAGRDVLRAQALVKQFDLDAMGSALDLLIVTSAERTKLVRLEELVEYDDRPTASGYQAVKAVRAEDALTSAIVSVTRGRKPKILFAQGHGERDPRGADELGYAAWTRDLEQQDFEVATWQAFGSSEVPPDSDLLVIAGPQSTWLEQEVSAVEKYVAGGGRVLLLIEPNLPRVGATPPPLGFERLLARWGITVHSDIVIDRENGVLLAGLETFAPPLLALHPVTESIKNERVILSLTRSFAADNPPSDVIVNTLAETAVSGWGETDLGNLDKVAQGDSDLRGPLAVLLAGEQKPETKDSTTPPAARFIVCGDADLANNRLINSARNRDFLINAVNWLGDQKVSLGIAAKDRALTRLFITAEQSMQLLFSLVIGFPLLAVATGIAIWRIRRRVPAA